MPIQLMLFLLIFTSSSAVLFAFAHVFRLSTSLLLTTTKSINYVLGSLLSLMNFVNDDRINFNLLSFFVSTSILLFTSTNEDGRVEQRILEETNKPIKINKIKRMINMLFKIDNGGHQFMKNDYDTHTSTHTKFLTFSFFLQLFDNMPC